jgi:hypothetical protein
MFSYYYTSTTRLNFRCLYEVFAFKSFSRFFERLGCLAVNKTGQVRKRIVLTKFTGQRAVYPTKSCYCVHYLTTYTCYQRLFSNPATINLFDETLYKTDPIVPDSSRHQIYLELYQKICYIVDIHHITYCYIVDSYLNRVIFI